MKKPLRHIFDYLVLSLLMSLGIVFALYFNGNRFFEIANVVGLSVVYILWGAIHHFREHTFYPQILLEYILFAALGGSIVIGLI